MGGLSDVNAFFGLYVRDDLAVGGYHDIAVFGNHLDGDRLIARDDRGAHRERMRADGRDNECLQIRMEDGTTRREAVAG